MLVELDKKQGKLYNIPYKWEANHDDKIMVFSIVYNGKKICREVGNVYGVSVSNEIFELLTSMEMDLALEQYRNECEMDEIIKGLR